MSRVAKAPIVIPKGVEIKIDNTNLSVKGPKGLAQYTFNKLVAITHEASDENKLVFGPASNDSNAWAQAGTARALAANMIHGVTVGFEKTLELVGVGYRAQVKPGVLSLSLGYSHPIEYKIPQGITIEAPSVTSVIIKGIDKQLVGQVAANIRAYRAPEPYKGKGIRYAGEVIAMKETKKK